MADIAIFRINYKSDFILTLQSDAGWLTPFCIKFWTGAPSQAYFAGYDGTTYTHCAPVDGDHTKLSVQFDDHHLPIGDLKFQIGYHFTVADFPTSIEDEVINQAAVIIDNDGEQQQVMLDFNGETAPDIAFSLPAYANEAQRIANEQVRIAAEEQRVSNEQQRISNEEGRISAEERRQEHEQQRIHNEETRIDEFARLEADAIAATGAANDAATLANEKAQLASDKAALAQSAATLASDKAQLAADKAALAQAAATLANDKAALAQQKADYAQAKGDYAQAQGDYAKAQGDIALADHERAEADHDTATDDHTTATSDHTQAESDHTRAEADHTTAASDHTQASSDHDRAESDHTKAGQDHDRAESDHTTAAADHTRAESDHAAVEVYVDSLGAFDISAYHATGSVLAKYADLTAALGTNGANIPDALRKGGMSVKFVLSSDNNYVQSRYMSSDASTVATFTNVANWQGVDDEPVLNSENLVESGGVAAKNQVYDSVINSSISPNLFDKTKIIENRYVRYDNGKATSSSGSGYFCTDYIPIDSEGAYAALGVTSGYRGFACYSDKSESAYTHGAVSSNKQAVYQEGDAYVRYTGKLEDVDRFMVVKGTSADYPSAYLPFGNIGELKESTVGNSQIQDSAVNHSKLATKSVNEENLSEQYWLTVGISVYGDTVKEIFFLDKAIPEGVSLTGHFYAGKVIFTASLNGTTIWTIDRQFASNYFYNNVVYKLRCSTSNIETIAVGDVVGYIVFADIDTAKAIVDGNNRTVNIPRVKYLLNNPIIATQTYSIKDSEIVTGMIADDAVSFEKIGFKTIAVISKNFLNADDPDFKHEQGYYINYNTGNTGYSYTSPSANGYTGFIPVSSKGLYFNAYVSKGVFAGAVYDKNKVYKRSLKNAQYTHQEGDGYVRWTLAANPISPYTEVQYMVWEGDSSVLPEYDEYEAKDVIDPEVLPQSDAIIQDGSVTEAKLADDVKNSIAGLGVEICIPDEIPCVVGDTLRIYFRSIVKAPNPYIWDIIAVSTVGKSWPRYYEYKPTAAGNKSVTFYVRNAKMKVVAQKTVTLKCINHISSPSSNKNILMVGASMMADGTITNELNRRLTSDTGDGTPYNPTGLNLSNITFVGRKTGTSYPNIHQEANSGWSWKDYATVGRYAYRFFVVGQVGIDVQPGAVYSGAGTLKFTVSQTDIDIDRSTGTGYFTCTYSGSGTQPASGTLTLDEGEGDATITYDSFNLDSGNPFWNDSTSELDFISYANDYCNDAIDILLNFSAMNDFTAVGENELAGRIETYVKPFIRAFHEQFPNSIFVLCTMYLGSISGGMATSYGASGTWNYYTCARKVWKWSELVRELAADEEFSSFVRVIDTNSSFDAENLYPTGNRTVANRSEATEVVQTNGVHTTANGKKALADGMYEGLNLIMQQT